MIAIWNCNSANDMNWDDLRYIRALGTAGTLAKAALVLGVHHSTVFRRMERIEAELAVRLFDRHRDGISLTPAGEEAVATAERLGVEVDALERHLAGRDTSPTGNVRLTTTDTLLEGVLGPLLAEFRRHYPGIQLEVAVGNPFLNLSRRDADIALRPTATPQETLVGRRIADVATAIYAAREYLAEAPGTDRLDAHAWIAPDESLAHLKSVHWLRTQLPGVVPVLRCNSLTAMLAAVRSGVGLAALPCFMGDRACELVRVRDPLPEFTVGLWLLTHRDLRRVARVRAVLDYLYDALAQRRTWFEGRRS